MLRLAHARASLERMRLQAGRPTVYVLGGYVPNGGTYMAYHVGRLVQRHWDYDCRVVLVGDERCGEMFDYPDEYDSVDIATLERMVRPDDLLIVNPSFSGYAFGFRLHCRTLMYIQGFNTFAVLDGPIDYRACVSQVVKEYVRLIYDWDLPVIPAFIDANLDAAVPPWLRRPEARVLVYGKAFLPQLLRALGDEMSRRHGDVQFEFVPVEAGRHRAFREQLGRFRYFLALSPCEGFGLPALEAMSAGCTVVGFHGAGGLQFMRPGVNCATVGYPRVAQVADDLATLLRDPVRAQQLAVNAVTTAGEFGYDAFEARWLAFLAGKLD